MAASLQPSPHPHCTRRQTTSDPSQQPTEALHLAELLPGAEFVEPSRLEPVLTHERHLRTVSTNEPRIVAMPRFIAGRSLVDIHQRDGTVIVDEDLPHLCLRCPLGHLADANH